MLRLRCIQCVGLVSQAKVGWCQQSKYSQLRYTISASGVTLFHKKILWLCSTGKKSLSCPSKPLNKQKESWLEDQSFTFRSHNSPIFRSLFFISESGGAASPKHPQISRKQNIRPCVYSLLQKHSVVAFFFLFLSQHVWNELKTM